MQTKSNVAERISIAVLLKNIQSGLKLYSPDDLLSQINNSIVESLNKKDNNKEYIDLAIQIVCEEYLISKRTLIKSAARGKVQEAKMVSYCLLHCDLDLPIRYISIRVFNRKWHTPVARGITYYKTLNLDIKEQKQFYDTYLRLKNKLMQKLKTLN